ncbi:hypothetical protein SCARD494_04179 [Seiridium cardinale]
MQYSMLLAAIAGSTFAMAEPITITRRGRTGTALSYCQRVAIQTCEHWDTVGVIAMTNCQNAELSTCMSQNGVEGTTGNVKRTLKPGEVAGHLPDQAGDDFTVDVQYGDSKDTIVTLPLKAGN